MSKVKTDKLPMDKIIEIAGTINAKRIALEGLTRKEKIREKARIRRIRKKKAAPNLKFW